MASGGEGISGVAVVLATAGGVLLYAGFQGLDPLQALKDITSGKTKSLEPAQISWTNDPSTVGQGGGSGLASIGYSGGPAPAGTHPEIAAAALRHTGEKYSQARRWQAGYSDCSSFVGKALKDCGITPPGGSVTGSYLVWRSLKTISRSEIQAGDILCGSGHIAIALSPTTAIGQQNGRQNVRRDSINNIMWGQSSWIPRRYVGASSSGSGRTASV
jgi:cell wall-associated NlpC family hydrolase